MEASEPQKPATRKPTKVAVITTGPGLIMPMATAMRKSRGESQPVCCTRPFSRKGTMTRPLPKVRLPALRKNSASLPMTEGVAAWGAAAAAAGTATIAADAAGGLRPRNSVPYQSTPMTPATMNRMATSALSTTVTRKAVTAITHCTQSSMPSLVSRQQECRIMAITAGLAP